MFAIALALSLLAQPALAYIGPGAGITVLGALWGVVVAVVLALAALLWWPLRVLFRRRRKPAHAPEIAAAVSTSGNPRDAREPSSR
jgi:hypothetical protein